MPLAKPLTIAAATCLALFSWTPGVQADLYDAAADWLSTYSTSSTAASATSATWGAGNAWSAGEMSFNWTNQTAAVGNSSLQVMTTYYLPSTGYTSNTSTAHLAAYSYTVPWQTYQFTPGQTIQQAVGQTVTQQLALGSSGHLTFQGTTAGEVAPTLPAGYSSAGAASGLINEVGADKTPASNVEGFTTSAFATTGGPGFNDGGGKVPDSDLGGVWYDYGATVTGTGFEADPNRNFASSGTYDTLGMTNDFGPTYVAWTAPADGTVSVNMSAYDEYYSESAQDFDTGFYVLTSADGPTAPIFSAPYQMLEGSQYETFNMLVNPSTTIAGSTITDVSGSDPLGTGAAYGLQWASGIFSVAAGETLFFTSDPNHDQYGEHSNHLFGSNNPMALSAQVSFTPVPEPSTWVMLTIGAVALLDRGVRRRSSACRAA